VRSLDGVYPAFVAEVEIEVAVEVEDPALDGAGIQALPVSTMSDSIGNL